MKTNIVIPCHNRWELTKQTLDSLFANTPEDLYDLWVVDDLSAQDDRQKLIQYHEEGHKFTLILNPENIGPAASRNETCKLITEKGLRGDYLYHSDNDVYFCPNWLDILTKVFDKCKHEIKVLGASCHPYLQDKALSLDEQLRFIYSIYDEHTRELLKASGNNIRSDYKVGLKDAVSGYSQLMTWDTWDKYGPFSDSNRNEAMKIMGSEDWAFCQNIIKDGFKVGSVEPELIVPCGRTNTYGNPATGHETFKDIEGVKVI